MSSPPVTLAIGTNCSPWLRSSTSALVFAALRSYSATVLPAPLIRQAYANVAPTLPAPTNAIFGGVAIAPRITASLLPSTTPG